MNNTNSSPVIFASLDLFFTLAGSTLILNQLYLYLLPVINTLGLVLNLFNLLVFRSSGLAAPFYKYLRVYSINSAVICLLLVFQFVENAPRYFHPALSYSVVAFYSFFYVPVTNTFYFNALLLDILITLDRIASINLHFRSQFNKLSPYLKCLIAFLICIAVNVPYFFVNVPFEATVGSSDSIVSIIWVVNLSNFATSRAGKITTFIVYGIRYLVSLAAQIILNGVSIRLFHQQARKKLVISGPRTEASRRRSATISTNAERRLTHTAYILCSLTIVENISLLIVIILPYFSSDKVHLGTISFLAALVISIKHSINFFVFFAFNKAYKKACMTLLGVSTNSSQSQI